MILKEEEMKSEKKGMVDVCFLTCRRLEFTRIAFQKLMENTDFDLVEKLIIVQDLPEEEQTIYFHRNLEWLRSRGISVVYTETKSRSVVFGMRYGMEKSEAKYFLKIDNDVVPGERWINCLVDTMESYPELVLLGYTKIWPEDFPKEKIVIKEGLDYGYLKCYNNVKKTIKHSGDFKKKVDVDPAYLRVHVGGSMIIRMEEVKPLIGEFDVKGRFLGWTDFQFRHVRKYGESGWYYPNIDGTLYLDNLKDRVYFDRLGIPYDEMCKLVDLYNRQGITKKKLRMAKEMSQEVISIRDKICLDV